MRIWVVDLEEYVIEELEVDDNRYTWEDLEDLHGEEVYMSRKLAEVRLKELLDGI